MNKSVRLFIGNYEADFGSAPDVLYTFKIDDITSPAAVKNSFSKTITLPGTSRNNRIFNQYWAGDRLTGNGFDATKKTPFTLYVDSEVYQTGYCKLNEVLQRKNAVEYSLSLFGGLGEFIANLEYEGEDRKKLSDLEYGQEIGFTINKETVEDAWDNIGTGKWGVMNFAVCYDGTPKDFDANKVLMNLGSGYTGSTHPDGWNPRPGRDTARNDGITTAITEDNKTYTTYGGYAVADLSRDYTSAEMREFRSYLMRPVLNVKSVIEACCNPVNNGGYAVELDADWFNQSNPYWSKLWITRPLLSTLEYNPAEVATGVSVSTGAKETGTRTASGDPEYFEDTLAILSETGNTLPYDVSVNISLDLNCSAATGDTLVLCGYNTSQYIYYPSAIFAQVVAYDVAGNPVAGGDSVYLTSSYGQRRSADGRSSSAYFIEPSYWDYTQPYGNGCVKSGVYYFDKVSNGKYRWAESINLSAQNIPANSTLKILITRVYKSGNRPNSGQAIFEPVVQSGQAIRYNTYALEDFDVVINSSQVAFKTDTGIRTGASFTKKQLLDTQYSPASFLLSYCKCFGLYLLQDAVEKKVSILTRKNFFQRSNVEDIERYVDRQDFKITPLVFTTKWYDWNLDADESEYGKAYETTYGKKYGQQLVDTEYNFDNGTTEVLTGNVFRNAVQVLERSNAFCYTQNDAKLKPYMFAGFKYLLYNTQDNTDTYEVEVNASSTIDAFLGLSKDYYDLFDKVQLHGDGNNPAGGADVLLFYGGKKSLQIGDTQLNYFITDDNAYMNILNQSRPCWLFTNSETDAQGQSIATRVSEAPYFSRYEITSTGYITKSLDFGVPEETYIPNVVRLSGNTIYEQCWKSYIADLYNKDTHVINTKMCFKKKPDFGFLRRFFWFNGGIYRMTAINDYNAAKNGLTDVEFVKVQDVENYTSITPQSGGTLTLTLDELSIAPTGGEMGFTITAEAGTEWHLQPSVGYCDVVSGTGSYTGVWTIPANASGSFVQHYLTAIGEGMSATASLTQDGYDVQITLIDTDEVPASGGTVRFKVAVNGSSWSANTDYGQILTDIWPSSGYATTGRTLYVEVAPNEYESVRTAYIYIELPNGIRRRSSNIIQEAYSPEPTEPYFYFYDSASGTTGTTTALTLEWYAATNLIDYRTNATALTINAGGAEWITGIVPANPARITVLSNETGSARTATLTWTVGYGDGTSEIYTCTLTQKTSGQTFNLRYTLADVPIPSSGSTMRFEYKCDESAWRVDVISGSTFLSIRPSSGSPTSGDYENFYMITQPNTGSTRDISFRFVNEATGTFIPFITTQYGGYVPPTPRNDYLYFKRLSGATDDWQLVISNIETGETVEYSYDSGTTWNQYITGVDSVRWNQSTFYFPLDVNADKVLVRCSAPIKDQLGARVCKVSGSTDMRYEVGGNFLSVLYRWDFDGRFEGQAYFGDDKNIYDARNLYLPCEDCVRAFENCTNLAYAPSSLPKPPQGMTPSYSRMFYDCKSLQTIPDIEADSARTSAYYYMFGNCKALIDISNNTIKVGETYNSSVFQGMFSACSALIGGPTIDTPHLTQDMCKDMFYGCTGLTSLTITATSSSKVSSYTDNTNAISNILNGNTQNGVLTVPAVRDFTYGRGASYIPNSWTISETL